MPKTRKPNFAKASLGKPAKSSKKSLKRVSSPVSKPTPKSKPKKFTQKQHSLFGFGNFLNKLKIPKMTIRTKLLLAIGFVFLATSLFWHLNQTIQLAFFTPKISTNMGSGPVPITIEIPRVHVDLGVEQTAITGGVWGVSTRGASYLTTSARPGENGPIILYSHNTNERFGPIRWLMPDDEVRITTLDNRIHIYKVTKLLTVKPNQIDILTSHKDETLILYTCDGFADLQRFVVIATPK